MAQFQNYFDTLGIEPSELEGLSEKDIQKELKQAKRELSKLNSPDIARANGASEEDIAAGEEHLKRVNHAFDVLKDPNSRAQHIQDINALNTPRQAQQPKREHSQPRQAKPRRPQQKRTQEKAQPKPKPQRKAKQKRPSSAQTKPRKRGGALPATLRFSGFLLMTTFKAAAKGIDMPLSYVAKKHARLVQASKTSKRAMALRVALGIPKFVLQTAPPLLITASLLLGAIKTAQTPLGGIPQEFRNASNPICTDEFSNHLSASDFNTVAWLYASTDNPRFHQMLLSNTRAHIQTGFNLEYALIQAYIESSFGENRVATTSTARGNHQFLEQSWLERFKKDAAQFDPAYAELASQIYWANGSDGKPLPSNGWRVRNGHKQDILDLRMENPDLEAFLSLNWRKELHPELVTAQGEAEPKSGTQALLEFSNFDILANALASIPEYVANTIHKSEPRVSDAEIDAVERFSLLAQFNAAYRSQLLGPTGSQRFETELGHPSRKFNTASRMFEAQAEANRGIFGRTGGFSFIEVDERIQGKINDGVDAIERAKFAGLVNGGIESVCDTRYGVEPEAADQPQTDQPDLSKHRPKARPPGLGKS